MSQELISAFFAVSLFGGLFYWSIFPFLGETNAIHICTKCSTGLTRYGWCPQCRKKTGK